jgi:hypothetical protein
LAGHLKQRSPLHLAPLAIAVEGKANLLCQIENAVGDSAKKNGAALARGPCATFWVGIVAPVGTASRGEKREEPDRLAFDDVSAGRRGQLGIDRAIRVS